MRYFAEISYRGTHYNGWQIQENTANTVQNLINKALGFLLRHEVETFAGGRTDAGVHCKSQFIHFETPIILTETKFEITQVIPETINETTLNITIYKHDFLHKLNRILPDDIYVKNIIKVKPNAHARFDAISRAYEYHISLEKNPFAEGLMLRHWHKLDVHLMNEAAKLLTQYSDFECFSKVKTDVKTFNCNIYRAEWIKNDDNNMLIFHIKANRFLRGMVRAIVGTLIDVGRGKTTQEGFENIILSKKRTQAGRNVSPQGLFLTEIAYPKTIFLDD
jgi:tRNA pseudouridine38-40 synthase